MSRRYDRDPYAILGLPVYATARQVKEAYHRLARQYHPDLNKDLLAVERMKDINWANDILSDPKERSLYDLWRSSTVRQVDDDSVTNSPYPHSTPPSRSTSHYPPPSAESQTYTSPPYSPPARPTPARVSKNSQSFGCSPVAIAWLIIMILINLGRVIQPYSQSGNGYYPENMTTRTAMAEKLDSAIETLHASDGLSTTSNSDTPFPLFSILITETPITKDEKDAPEQEDRQSGIVPGSWVWEKIHAYFPELTTPDGLSDEVTLVIYDQLRGYQIKTRNSGEYWLYIDRNNHSIIPAHFPPVATVTPIH